MHQHQRTTTQPGVKTRIGIYAGTFDPVHAGHVTFALQAMQAAQLAEVYFLPERRPRFKPGVEHFAHRVAMLKQAARPHPNFRVLELVDSSFSVSRTLPRLQKQFKDAQLVFLFGSDVIAGLPSWPNVQSLLRVSELVIGVRTKDDQVDLDRQISGWNVQPLAVTMFEGYSPTVSSTEVRAGLRGRLPVSGLLDSVARYSNHHWLYVSLK